MSEKIQELTKNIEAFRQAIHSSGITTKEAEKGIIEAQKACTFENTSKNLQILLTVIRGDKENP